MDLAPGSDRRLEEAFREAPLLPELRARAAPYSQDARGKNENPSCRGFLPMKLRSC